jgi:hypothetical protein
MTQRRVVSCRNPEYRSFRKVSVSGVTCFRMNFKSPTPPRARALLTDLYELTMAYAYWKSGKTDQEAVFHLLFRHHPFHGGFTICCGLADVIEYLQNFRFDQSDVNYLKTLKGNDGKRLFDPVFLKFLRGLRLNLDVDAIPEGTVVFPQEPLIRIRGSILQGQIVLPMSSPEKFSAFRPAAPMRTVGSCLFRMNSPPSMLTPMPCLTIAPSLWILTTRSMASATPWKPASACANAAIKWPASALIPATSRISASRRAKFSTPPVFAMPSSSAATT